MRDGWNENIFWASSKVYDPLDFSTEGRDVFKVSTSAINIKLLKCKQEGNIGVVMEELKH